MSDQRSDKRTGAKGGSPTPEVKIPDPVELSRMMGEIAERSRKIVADFLRREGAKPNLGLADPLNIGQAFFDMTARLMTSPCGRTT